MKLVVNALLFWLVFLFVRQNSSFASQELMNAVWAQDVTEVRRLLDAGANVNYTNVNGITPLMIVGSRLEIAQLLVDRGANVNARSVSGESSLYHAARTSIEVVQLLLDRGANVNQNSNDGQTPLHCAAIVCRPDIVRLLLDRGANVNPSGWYTPLSAAVGADGCPVVVQLLLDRGANVGEGSTLSEKASEIAHGIERDFADDPQMVAMRDNSFEVVRLVVAAEAARNEREAESARVMERGRAARAARAQANRESLDPQVVARQAQLDAESAVEAYDVAAQASLDAQAAAAREPLNMELATARDRTARAALEAQNASARAALYAQTTRETAREVLTRARHQAEIAALQEGHREQVDALRAMVRVLCFPAETPISVKDDSPEGYHSQPISSIRVGDRVVSCNLEEEGGTCESASVQDVIETTADHLIRLTVNGKALQATDNHPFYLVDKKKWVEAKDLRIGDQLRSITGETVAIEDLQGESGTFRVYNLDVRKRHNYFACDLLVHNCNSLRVPVPEGI